MRKEIGAERLLDMHQRNVEFAKKEEKRNETQRHRVQREEEEKN